MPRNSRRLLMIIALLPFVAAGASLPQTAYAQTAQSGKCVAPLPPAPGENRNDQDKNQDLSQKLDTCNGELKAPPVGDGKMVEPAPVIRVPFLRTDVHDLDGLAIVGDHLFGRA